MNEQEQKTINLIDNSSASMPLIEVEVELCDGCAIIYDAFSGCVIGEWCAPDVAKKVWETPQAFV